jgi:hypothetical protein
MSISHILLFFILLEISESEARLILAIRSMQNPYGIVTVLQDWLEIGLPEIPRANVAVRAQLLGIQTILQELQSIIPKQEPHP